jgi:predicted alpha/beta superfamily hydrolase
VIHPLQHPSHGHFEDLGTIHPHGLGLRHVRAFVPPRGLAGDAGARPLLILFDGQNVFGDRGSFAGGWHVHEAVARFAHTRRAAAPIVVAIDNGGTARIDELAPFHDGARGGGRLPALLAAVTDVLVPRVQARFEIGARFIGGASLGGLAALVAHLTRPDVFAGALAMSPSLWFTRMKVSALLHGLPRPPRSRVYLDCGGREGVAMRPAIEAFADRLRRRGWQDSPARTDLRLMLRPDARGRHNEKAWRRRFPKALRFMLAA